MRALELWELQSSAHPAPSNAGFDATIGPRHTHPTYILEKNHVYQNEKLIGAYLSIESSAEQNRAISLLGSLEILVLDCKNWMMIPLENIIAARKGSPTKIATIMREPHDASGLGFALEIGVDVLIVDQQDDASKEAALITKAQRAERLPQTIAKSHHQSMTKLQSLLVQSVEDGGVGDRYCIDFTRLLEEGDGVIVGSTSQLMCFVHSETIPSEYVPSRPFRVNAGAAHSYILMADGTTKYLSELQPNNEVMIFNVNGAVSSASIGRVKIETRPFLMIHYSTQQGEAQSTGQHFLQQAETVRLVGDSAQPISITEVQPGHIILGLHSIEARHIGQAVEMHMEER